LYEYIAIPTGAIEPVFEDGTAPDAEWAVAAKFAVGAGAANACNCPLVSRLGLV
jgi:hypothetical protein